MVFDDIVKDYESLMSAIYRHNRLGGYINMASGMVDKYQTEIEHVVDIFMDSARDYNACGELGISLQKAEAFAAQEIAQLNYGVRSAIRLIAEIEGITFTSFSVKQAAELLCGYLNTLIDGTAEYVENKILGKDDAKCFSRLIKLLKEFNDAYGQISSNYQFLLQQGEEVQGALPQEISEEDTVHYLDIRSAKSSADLYTFADDLKLLTDSLISLERLAAPDENHTIFIRKIESGSLKAEFGSKKIELSVFRDIVESISNAIRRWRLTPSEICKGEAEAGRIEAEAEKIRAEAEKTKAEAQMILTEVEAQHVQNQGTRLAIARTQIDYICEKLKLNPNDADKREQIEKLCLSTMKYLEQNPVGSINGTVYDLSKEVGTIEDNKGR
ncbi:hypothetical protein V1224_13170 [Lachnospiraceae bacterium JLR.KK008]